MMKPGGDRPPERDRFGIEVAPALPISISRCQAGRLRCLACLAVLSLVVAGCISIGPRSVPRDRVDYSNAASDSWKDQMLLNIVRLRYADTPTFLDVSSVISAYTIQGAAQATGSVNVGVPNDTSITPNGTGSLTVQGGYNDRPTISYTPLTGKKFAQSLLQPIPPSAIFSLIAAGYPADIVILTTDALHRIQLSRAFSMRIEKRGDEQVTIGVFAPRLDPELRRDLDLVKKILNLRADNGEVTLNYGALQRSPSELAVLSRSMIEIMQELSADINVPAESVASGRTYPSAVVPVDASQHDQPRVRIDSGPAPPDDAFAAVLYRGVWYWISDHDIHSKRSLTFLLLFFSLAETGVVPDSPVLTIPVQ
jgi:hypothetical protein